LEPIFVLGILGRSGTNYLSNLIGLHPDCELITSIPEDWLLAESHLMVQYTQAVYRNWIDHKDWEICAQSEPQLFQALGNGLISFLKENLQLDNGKKLVTKTPSVKNLSNFFTLFPDAHLLILVRDGRDIAESIAHSVGIHRDQVTRWWAWAAREILAFERTNRNKSQQYRIIRFEDLVLNPHKELDAIIDFVGLDKQIYPFEDSHNLPVYGTSMYMNEMDEWEWKVIQKPENFIPMQRWSCWSRKKHERFNWIAGDLLAEFGYQAVQYPGVRASKFLYNTLIDGIQKISEGVGRFVSKVIPSSERANTY